MIGEAYLCIGIGMMNRYVALYPGYSGVQYVDRVDG